MRKLLQQGPIFRISLAIVSLMMAIVLIFDSFFGLLPSNLDQQVEVHKQICLTVSDQIARALANDDQELNKLLEQMMVRNPSIQSIGLRREDRTLIASTKDHIQKWGDIARQKSTPTHIMVPLIIKGKPWGNAEFRFDDGGIKEKLLQPSVKFVILFSTLGFLIVYFYLRRVLQHLDPSHAVPQRVKNAFDTLAEAVVLIGPKNHVLLANASFHKMNAGSQVDIEGGSILQFKWLLDGLAEHRTADGYPWDDAIRSNKAGLPKKIKVTFPNGIRHELIMNCCPIDDGTGVARGCLTTFDDVTELSETNEKLQIAMEELKISKEQIEEQHRELQKHANLDPLTGCINRRAFFELAQPIFDSAPTKGTDLHCVMCDIDHFKSFNDKYGHSVGDMVIQQVVNAMRRSLRSVDLLCRYGGEEFCILLDCDHAVSAVEIAERMRDTVERESGAGVRTIEGLRITSSFGVSVYDPNNPVKDLGELIDQADQALYDSKHNGRNRVTQYSPKKEEKV